MRSRANPSKFTDRRGRFFARGIATLVVALGLSFVPTPYYLIAPGKAVELATRVSVEGRPPPLRRFYLTDVTVARASVLLLAACVWPGVRIVRRDVLVPAGESARGYDRAMVDAMGESQIAAAIVAERAAGYRVPEPPRQVVAVDFLPASRADGILAAGDALTRVNGVAIRDVGDVAGALRGVAPGTPVAVSIVRAGRAIARRVVTIPGLHGARLGVLLARRTSRPALPVPVQYAMGDIAGSSAGLMFALEIYTSLRPGAARDPIAGTGTLTTDGRVGPIEGARQKLIAAERAGAATFLIPRENYPELTHDDNSKIRVIPVTTFADALAAIR